MQNSRLINGRKAWLRSWDTVAFTIYYVLIGILAFHLDLVYLHGGSLPWAFREGLKDTVWVCLLPLFIPIVVKAKIPLAWWIYFGIFFALIGISLALNAPEDHRIELAVLRNNMLYSVIPFIVGFQIARRGLNCSFEKLLANLAIFQALLAIAQKALEWKSPYLDSIKPDEHSVAHGGFLSYIEFSSFLCIGLVYVATKKKMTGITAIKLLLLSFAVFLSTARLGLIMVLLIFLLRFRLRAAFWLIPSAVVVAALVTTGTAVRLFSEGLETPRLAIWHTFLSENPMHFVGLKYGFYGSATSAGGETNARYLDSTIVAGYLQGGILGLALVLWPYVTLLGREFKVNIRRPLISFVAAGMVTRLEPIRLKNTLLLLVLLSYAFVFNFMDGWPGNFVSWSIFGIIEGCYAKRGCNFNGYCPDQERGE